MKRTKQFAIICLALVFLTACRTTINNKKPIMNSEGNTNENNNKHDNNNDESRSYR